jgi:hypothetical protein
MGVSGESSVCFSTPYAREREEVREYKKQIYKGLELIHQIQQIHPRVLPPPETPAGAVEPVAILLWRCLGGPTVRAATKRDGGHPGPPGAARSYLPTTTAARFAPGGVSGRVGATRAAYAPPASNETRRSSRER